MPLPRSSDYVENASPPYKSLKDKFQTLVDPIAQFADDAQDLAVFNASGVLTVLTGTARYRFPWAVTLIGVTATVGVAPTGASVIVDVNKNGTTIFSTQANRPTIPISGFATTTEPAPNTTTLVAGDYLTVDIDQIGSSVAGSNLVVFVRYRRT